MRTPSIRGGRPVMRTASAVALVAAVVPGSRAALEAARRLDLARPHDAAAALLDAVRAHRGNGPAPEPGAVRDALDALLEAMQRRHETLRPRRSRRVANTQPQPRKAAPGPRP